MERTSTSVAPPQRRSRGIERRTGRRPTTTALAAVALAVAPCRPFFLLRPASATNWSGWWRRFGAVFGDYVDGVGQKTTTAAAAGTAHHAEELVWDWRNDDWWNDESGLVRVDGYAGRSGAYCRFGDPSRPELDLGGPDDDHWKVYYDVIDGPNDAKGCADECEARGLMCKGFEYSERSNDAAGFILGGWKATAERECKIWKVAVGYMKGGNAQRGGCYRKSADPSPSDASASLPSDDDVSYETQANAACRYDASRRSEDLAGPNDPIVAASKGGDTAYYDVDGHTSLLSQCRAKCTARADCQGFEHDLIEKRCELWTSKVGYAVPSPKLGVCALKITAKAKEDAVSWTWWSDREGREREFASTAAGASEAGRTESESSDGDDDLVAFAFPWQKADDGSVDGEAGSAGATPTAVDSPGKLLYQDSEHAWVKVDTNTKIESPWDVGSFGKDVDEDGDAFERGVSWKVMSWYANWTITKPGLGKGRGGDVAQQMPRGTQDRLDDLMRKFESLMSTNGRREIRKAEEQDPEPAAAVTTATSAPMMDESILINEVMAYSKEVLESESYLEAERDERWEFMRSAQQAVCQRFDEWSFKSDGKIEEHCVFDDEDNAKDALLELCDQKISDILAAEDEEFEGICGEQREEREAFTWGYYQKNLELLDRVDAIREALQAFLDVIPQRLQEEQDKLDAGEVGSSQEAVEQRQVELELVQLEADVQDELSTKLTRKIEKVEDVQDAQICFEICGIGRIMTDEEVGIFDREVAKSLQWSYMKEGQEVNILGAFGTVQEALTDVTDDIELDLRLLRGLRTTGRDGRRRRCKTRSRAIVKTDATCSHPCTTSGTEGELKDMDTIDRRQRRRVKEESEDESESKDKEEKNSKWYSTSPSSSLSVLMSGSAFASNSDKCKVPSGFRTHAALFTEDGAFCPSTNASLALTDGHGAKLGGIIHGDYRTPATNFTMFEYELFFDQQERSYDSFVVSWLGECGILRTTNFDREVEMDFTGVDKTSCTYGLRVVNPVAPETGVSGGTFQLYVQGRANIGVVTIAINHRPGNSKNGEVCYVEVPGPMCPKGSMHPKGEAESDNAIVARRDDHILLYSGDRLYSGMTIVLERYGVFLRQREQGTLTLYEGVPSETGEPLVDRNDVLWSSDFSGGGGKLYSLLQKDGNLVTKDEANSNAIVWETKAIKSIGQNEYFLALKEDKSEVFLASGTPDDPTAVLWSENTPYKDLKDGGDVLLFEGETMKWGTSREAATNEGGDIKEVRFQVERRGSLELHIKYRDRPEAILWKAPFESQTFFKEFYVELEGDGCLRAKLEKDDRAVWSSEGIFDSHTEKSHYLSLVRDDAGKPIGMAIYAGVRSQRMIWSTIPGLPTTSSPTPPLPYLQETITIKDDIGEEVDVNILEYRMQKALVSNLKEAFPRENNIEVTRVSCDAAP